VHSKENERLAKEMGVKKVCLPKAGKKSIEREEARAARMVQESQEVSGGDRGTHKRHEAPPISEPLSG
jgi:hypothetical protein